MAPKYRLHYFDLPGRAEPARLLLSYGGLDFEDVRVGREDWPKIKQTMPLGQLPVLEIDGNLIPQSSAIYRYLAAKVNLSGKDAVENLKIDVAVATLEDFRKKVADWSYERDETKKNATKQELFEKTIPFYLDTLEKRTQENGGYIALDRLTWADILFLCAYESLGNLLKKEPLVGYPNLTKLKDSVLAVPSIKEWIKKRPASPTTTFDLKSQV